MALIAELQFLRFRRPHDPHVLAVHCGHSSSSALNLHVQQQVLIARQRRSDKSFSLNFQQSLKAASSVHTL
jgi:hypothetical protein